MQPADPAYPPVYQQPSTTVVVMQTAPPIICDGYATRRSIGIGIALIIIGILCPIFNGVLFIAGSDGVKYNGHGFWSAFFFIAAGSLGIVAGRSKTRGSITGFLVMTILSACCSAPVFAFAMIGAIYARPTSPCGDYIYYYGYSNSCKNSYYDVAVALESMLAICSVVGGILSIFGSVTCCKSTCLCCGAAPLSSAGVIFPANYYPGMGQVMYINQNSSTNYLYSLGTPQQSQVASSPEQMSVGQTNWNQPPQSMPATGNGFAYQEPASFDSPPSYSYSKS